MHLLSIICEKQLKKEIQFHQTHLDPFVSLLFHICNATGNSESTKKIKDDNIVYVILTCIEQYMSLQTLH